MIRSGKTQDLRDIPNKIGMKSEGMISNNIFDANVCSTSSKHVADQLGRRLRGGSARPVLPCPDVMAAMMKSMGGGYCEVSGFFSGFCAAKVARYNCSTCALAQGVFRRKVRLDFTEGCCLKQLMLIKVASSSQPKCCSSKVTMCLSVRPCNWLLGCEFGIGKWV